MTILRVFVTAISLMMFSPLAFAKLPKGCLKEFKAVCADAKSKKEKRECAKKHKDELSQACQKGLMKKFASKKKKEKSPIMTASTGGSAANGSSGGMSAVDAQLRAQQQMAAAAGTGGTIVMVVYLLLLIVMVASLYMIFEKCGKQGFLAIIPVVNLFVLVSIVGRPWWFGLLFLIPVVGLVAAFMVFADLAKQFGRSTLFAVGMLFLPFVFLPMLAFGNGVAAPSDGLAAGF